MKKKTSKPTPLSKFEKRVEERHKRQEKEYGRDEFLFGAAEEDDEEVADVEYEEDNWDEVETEPEYVKANETDSQIEAETDDEPSVGIGTRTEMIANEIIEAELAAMAKDVVEDGAADEVSNDAAGPGEDVRVSATDIIEETSDELIRKDPLGDTVVVPAAAADNADTSDGTYASDGSFADDEDFEVKPEDDFDFYDMSETAEIRAAAVANRMYGRTGNEDRVRKPKVHHTPGAKPAPVPYSDSNSKHKSTKQRRDRHEDSGLMSGMSMSDKLIILTGVCVLIIAAAAGVFFVNARNISKQVDSFASVGASAEGIYIIGEEGLNAAVAARADYNAIPEEIIEDFIEPEILEPIEDVVIEDKNVQIVMKVSSVQSDLKIKFSNKSTGKLITGIPFEVTVTSDSGKEYNWSDENKDGIMYHTEVPNGTYKVVMKPLTGTEYENYTMAADVTGIKVTDTIEYKKVDVADEVKSEAEVNVAQEDTAVQDTAVESVLKDTVEWVESTKTPVGGEGAGGYEEISKDSIAAPTTTSKLNISTPQSGMTASQPLSMSSGIWQLPGSAAVTGAHVMGTVNPDTTTTDPNEPGAGDPTDPNPTDPTDPNPTDPNPTDPVNPNPTDPVNPDPPKPITVSLSVSPSTLMLKVGESSTVSASLSSDSGMVNADSVSFSSSDSSVATVDSSGKVTGVSKGFASIKVSVSYTASDGSTGTKEGSCQVGIAEADKPTPDNPTITVKSVTLDKTSLELKAGDKATLKVTIKWSDGNQGGNVVWASTKESVAKVADGTVTAVAEGTAQIIAASADDNSKYAVCTVKVKGTSNSTDNKTLLKTKDGKQVWVVGDDGQPRKAVASDYATAVKFFVEKAASYIYTGWQTIDGYTYFFTKDGQYVTGEQVIQGAKYTFDSSGRLSTGNGTFGIDVSKWNGNIDWNAVKNSGVSYVIIRCGYRGSTTGALIEDPKFRSNIQGAKAAGLSVGAYFFTQAVNEVEAVEEASMAVGLCSGYGLNLPLFLDVEHSGGRADSIGADMRTAVCKAFCQTVRNSGYTAGIYANKTWLTSYMHASQLTSYKIWLAQYAAAPTYSATRYDYWQYTSKGRVSGISGNVDMNIKY